MMVPKVGVEPTRVLSPADFESAASANSATSAVNLLTNHIILDQHPLFKHILLPGLCQDLVGELPRNFFYNSSGTILTIFLSM